MSDTMFAVIVAILIVIVAFMVYIIVMYHQSSNELRRIEKGLENNTHDLIETKAFNNHLNRSFDYLLTQTSQTKEYLSVSDAKLNALSHHITDMNAIMTNSKKRGNFGEYQLEHLLSLYCGEAKSIYELQYHLDSGRIPDAIMHLPDTTRVLCIDSKFPMTHYLQIVDNEGDPAAIKEFHRDVKKHIKDIARKYITEETLESAIMFIPSEAIYLYLCQEEGELIEYAHRHHVLMTSPSTLMGVVFTLVNITKDFNRSKNLEEMERVIIKMKSDSDLMRKRYEAMCITIDTLDKKVKELGISVGKVSRTIDTIYDGQTIYEDEKSTAG